MKPYFQDGQITLFHGDAREIAGDVALEIGAPFSVITDPVWPNCIPELRGSDDPEDLFSAVIAELCGAGMERLAVHLGCNSDPRFLRSLPRDLKFFRAVRLEYARPNYLGRLLYDFDLAYLFGTPPPVRNGARVIPGRCIDPSSNGKAGVAHPCPRKLAHVEWLVHWWGQGPILDPFTGSGTTLLAAKIHSFPAWGIEIEERFCEEAAKRLSGQTFMQFEASTA